MRSFPRETVDPVQRAVFGKEATDQGILLFVQAVLVGRVRMHASLDRAYTNDTIVTHYIHLLRNPNERIPLFVDYPYSLNP